MARTKDQLIQIIVNNKLDDLMAGANWGDLVSAVSGSAQEEKDAILAELVTKNDAQVGYLLRQLLIKQIKADGVIAANALLADNSLSLAELDLIL